MDTAIWWVRRDLRLADNQALTAALAEAGRVIPTVILDPVQLESPYAGPKPRAFFLAALRALDADLRAYGSRLVVRQGDPPEALARLAQETAAQAVFAEASVSPYARDRDARAAEVVPVRWFGGLTVHPPDAVRKADGKPYVVYTPFSRVWKALPPVSPDVLLPAPAQFPPPPDVPSLDLPTEPALPAGLPFSPGEEIAQQRLAAFLDGDDAPIYRYAAERDRMDLDTTSHLSPYLRLGMLSVQQAVAGALEAAARAPNDDALQGAETWLKELIWREFYMAILYNFPHVLEESFRPQYRAIPGPMTRATLLPGARVRRGIPWWMPRCASWPRLAGCTTAHVWWSPRSWSRTCLWTGAVGSVSLCSTWWTVTHRPTTAAGNGRLARGLMPRPTFAS